MTQKRCLILGGLGFIGSHITDALLANGFAVRIFNLPHPKTGHTTSILPQVELIEGDFADTLALKTALHNVDYVFHLISTTLPQTSNENPIHDVESNLISTLRLLQLAREANIKKVIFISSGGTVYGIPEQVPITENHPTLPLSSYGITKLTIEKYLHLFQHLYGLDYVILRVSNPYGERQQFIGAQQGVISVFMGRIVRHEPITIWGDGSVVRDFLYVKDMAQAFVLALNNHSPHRVFNVGSGVGLSLNQLLHSLESITGITPTIHYLPGRSVDVPANILDTTRIHDAWGWSVTTPLEQGLAQTWEWICQQKV